MRLFVSEGGDKPAFATVGAAWLKHQLWRAERGEVSQDWLQRVKETGRSSGLRTLTTAWRLLT